MNAVTATSNFSEVASGAAILKANLNEKEYFANLRFEEFCFRTRTPSRCIFKSEIYAFESLMTSNSARVPQESQISRLKPINIQQLQFNLFATFWFWLQEISGNLNRLLSARSVPADPFPEHYSLKDRSSNFE